MPAASLSGTGRHRRSRGVVAPGPDRGRGWCAAPTWP